MRFLAPLATSPLESGVLGFLARHLPPMGFLSPATAYSSSRFACFLSHKRHLWDSKSKSIGDYAELAPRSGKGCPLGSPVPVRKATDSAGGISLLLADTTPAAQCGVSLIRESNLPTGVVASLT
jgi:hypothetical protein